MRIHQIRTAIACSVAAVAAAGLSLAGAGASMAGERGSAAAPPPGFLSAEDLPPHPSSSWFAGEVTEGLPDPVPFCVDGVPSAGEGTWHRAFHTDLDTGATQLSVVADSTAAAEELAGELRESVAGCAADWLRDHPGGTASWQDFGTLETEDGAQVFGTYTALPESSHNVHLFGVGRDGDTVTVVAWGQIGTLQNAPVDDFRRTTRTAVGELRQ